MSSNKDILMYICQPKSPWLRSGYGSSIRFHHLWQGTEDRHHFERLRDGMYYKVSKCDDMTRPVEKHPYDQQIKKCCNSSVYPIQPATQQSKIFGDKGTTGLLKGDVGTAFVL
jgi:hypothetical protein